MKIFLDRFKSVTTGQLVKRDFVDIEDFGVFIVEEGKGRNLNIVEFDDADSFAARVGRNPQTGKEIKIAANGKNVVKFKAGADLSKKVN
ncbi:MAG: DNA-binding protein [Chloroflexi bacterium]|nr:DNA-binding protein [Chloroflexota bacterium]